MRFSALRRVVAGVAVAVTAATGLVAATTDSSSAASTCTLKASLPSKVVINKSSVTFYSTLSGSGNCRPVRGEFYGANAYFDGPDGIEDLPYWDNLGDKYRFDFYAYVGNPGTYRLEDGDALIWTADYDEVPVRWTSTKTSIRYGSKLSVATKRNGRKVTISGTAKKYTWLADYRAYKTTVYLQRRSKGSKTYKAYKTLKSNSSGKVSYSYNTKSKYYYRLVIKNTAGVWGSTTAGSYR
jgi:hypothetical protein